MNKIVACLMFFPLLAFSQQDTEASGQTPVFFLKAGATTKYPVSVVNPSFVHASSRYFFLYNCSSIKMLSPKGKSKISIYNASGRLMISITSASDGSASFSSPLHSGIYFAHCNPIDKPASTVLLDIRK
jgi:hypothetical protein